MNSAVDLLQTFLDRAAKRLSLEEAVKEVSRYVMGSELRWSWRQYIQSCPNISEEVLWVLAHGEDVNVRHWLAMRDHLPQNVLKVLAQDKDWAVRQAIRYRNYRKKRLEDLT